MGPDSRADSLAQPDQCPPIRRLAAWQQSASRTPLTGEGRQITCWKKPASHEPLAPGEAMHLARKMRDLIPLVDPRDNQEKQCLHHPGPGSPDILE